VRKLLNKSEVIILFLLISAALFLIGGIKINPDPNPIVQSFGGCSQAPTIPGGYSPNGNTSGNVIPVPAFVKKAPGEFVLSSNSQIYVNSAATDVVSIGQYLASKLNPSTGFNIPVIISSTNPTTNGSIYLTTEGADQLFGQEGYELEVTASKIILIAYTPEGLFRGIQTIRQLLPQEIDSTSFANEPTSYWTVSAGTIVDYPRYPYRGLMIDVARKFFGVTAVEKVIDAVTEYKINCLHLHLTDDQGWRLQINSQRSLTADEGSNYYTQDDYRQLIDYARTRYITIIPEIDLPGHSGYACSHGLDCAHPGSSAYYTFVDKILGEVAGLTPGRYIHIGGDESGLFLPLYNSIIEHLQSTVNKLQKVMLGWNETASASVQRPNAIQFWTDKKKDFLPDDVKRGVKILFSPGWLTYFAGLQGGRAIGYPYNWDPQTILSYVPNQQILGLEGALWLDGDIQDIDNVFPEIIGFAEIGWSPQSKRGDYNSYYNRLLSQTTRLTEMNLNFIASSSWIK